MSNGVSPEIAEHLVQILSELGEIKSKIMGLRQVFEANDKRLAALEQGLALVAEDAAQARDNTHKIQSKMTPMALSTEMLLDIAQGKARSSDTIRAQKERLTDALSK